MSIAAEPPNGAQSRRDMMFCHEVVMIPSIRSFRPDGAKALYLGPFAIDIAALTGLVPRPRP